MKVISIAAVTAGGKTTIVNALKSKLKNVKSLHFDDYTFEGEVQDFYLWVKEGANYNVWNLKPLEKDIIKIRDDNETEYLLLDYPFAYQNTLIKPYIDYAIFIDTPLDIAMARRVLRDMKDASGDEIRNDMEMYLKYARLAYEQMLTDILPFSDYVVDGTKTLDEIVNELRKIIRTMK